MIAEVGTSLQLVVIDLSLFVGGRVAFADADRRLTPNAIASALAEADDR